MSSPGSSSSASARSEAPSAPPTAPARTSASSPPSPSGGSPSISADASSSPPRIPARSTSKPTPALAAHRCQIQAAWKFIDRHIETQNGGKIILFTTDEPGRAEGWHRENEQELAKAPHHLQRSQVHPGRHLPGLRPLHLQRPALHQFARPHARHVLGIPHPPRARFPSPQGRPRRLPPHPARTHRHRHRQVRPPAPLHPLHAARRIHARRRRVPLRLRRPGAPPAHRREQPRRRTPQHVHRTQLATSSPSSRRTTAGPGSTSLRRKAAPISPSPIP